MANDIESDDVVTLWRAQGSDGFQMSTEKIQQRLETMNRTRDR